VTSIRFGILADQAHLARRIAAIATEKMPLNQALPASSRGGAQAARFFSDDFTSI
jgi:hypothetical protein